MNKSYEKYREAIEELPQLENQIEKILKLKHRLVDEGIQTELCLRANAIEVEKKYNDEPAMDFNSLLSIGWMSNPKKIENFDETGYVKVHERIAIGVCDLMLQNLVERRDMLIGMLNKLKR